MPKSSSPPALLRHAEFLGRIGDFTDGVTEPASRRGQAAFLALRVVDQLAGPWQENVQAFEYQRAATARYVNDLPDPDHPENARLRAILAQSSPETLGAPLLGALRDYAEYLEIVGALRESADVLVTLLDLGVGKESPQLWIEALQGAVRILVALERVDEAAVLHGRARVGLRGVSDVSIRIRTELAGIELMVGKRKVSDLDRAARRCWMRAERSGDPAVAWNAVVTLSRIFLDAGAAIEAALALEGIRTSDRLAPSPAAGLDYAEAHMRVGNLALARAALDQSLASDMSDTLRLRAGRVSAELCARMGDELGFARGMKELEALLDSAVVASLRDLLENSTN